MSPVPPISGGGGGGGGVSEAQMNAAIEAAVNDLVDGAPLALDKLSELADALNNDDNFAANITALAQAAQNEAGAAQVTADAALAATEGLARREEHVFDLRYFDTVGFGAGYAASSLLLFDGVVSENIANPFEGSDIIVSAQILLPGFRVFTEGVDQDSPVGRQAVLAITEGANSASSASWPFDYYSVRTLDRDPFMPDPLNANPTNGLGGYTVSEVLEVADSGPSINIAFQDYLNTDPVVPWVLYGYRVPVFGEAPLSHARLHVKIQEILAP